MSHKKDLIAQINRNLAVKPATRPKRRSAAQGPSRAAADQTSAREESSPVPPASATPPAAGSGKQAAFWLDDADRAIFYETGMLLYSQGIKPSDNLVLRAALRLMPRDHRLVEQVRALMGQDGRRLRHAKGPRLIN